ncbi:hypothetical protein [Glycomyces rhizosphaerae]|uniref:Immunity protein 63 domain-containing protein n=1 Tax=Glycomyces rhizosphaerae TaxID=2054422 RepID=A0ABV7Q153_9ACTN
MDDFFGPVTEDKAPGQEVLAGWIATDIGPSFRVLLDALAMIDDVQSGRPPFEEWSSDGYDVQFSPNGVTVQSLRGSRRRAEYPLAEARQALEDFWSFLSGQPERSNVRRQFRPDLPEWKADLLQWERTWNLRHPYRGRLGIPAQGPE